MLSHKLNSADALKFVLAGHSIFTIRKIETDGRFTYRVTVPEDQKEHPTLYFVSVLTGSDNNSDYSYIGYIRAQNNGSYTFYYGNKSKLSKTAPSVVVFEAVFNLLLQGIELKKLEIWHEGKCGRCGRTLTVPESIESGYGSECIKHVNRSMSAELF